MRLSLHLSKNYNIKDPYKHTFINIAVVDLDVSDKYPANFVCLLPKKLMPNNKYESKFQKKFGDKSQQILNSLLEQAIKTAGDVEFIVELENRLRINNSGVKNLVSCNVCGLKFKARKFGSKLQETCYGCLNKRNQ